LAPKSTTRVRAQNALRLQGQRAKGRGRPVGISAAASPWVRVLFPFPYALFPLCPVAFPLQPRTPSRGVSLPSASRRGHAPARAAGKVRGFSPFLVRSSFSVSDSAPRHTSRSLAGLARFANTPTAAPLLLARVLPEASGGKRALRPFSHRLSASPSVYSFSTTSYRAR